MSADTARAAAATWRAARSALTELGPRTARARGPDSARRQFPPHCTHGTVTQASGSLPRHVSCKSRASCPWPRIAAWLPLGSYHVSSRVTATFQTRSVFVSLRRVTACVGAEGPQVGRDAAGGPPAGLSGSVLDSRPTPGLSQKSPSDTSRRSH